MGTWRRVWSRKNMLTEHIVRLTYLLLYVLRFYTHSTLLISPFQNFARNAREMRRYLWETGRFWKQC